MWAKKFFSNVPCSLTIVGKDPFTFIYTSSSHTPNLGQEVWGYYAVQQRGRPYTASEGPAWEIIEQRREGILE